MATAGLKKGLWLTIALGLLFSSLQAYEYAHAPFAFGKNTYGSAFYMATGFHGFHVIVGTIFLAVCLKRAYNGDFTPAPALRLRGGGVVLALRRRGVAVPLRLHLCLGQLGLPG
jgi:heme/copper-type cytochrome/quinol oxidase subunit 3